MFKYIYKYNATIYYKTCIHTWVNNICVTNLHMVYLWYVRYIYAYVQNTIAIQPPPPFDHGQQSNSPKIKTVNKDCMVDYTGQYTDQQFPDHTITHIHFHSHNHTHSQYHTYIHTHHPQPPLVNRI